MASSLKSFLSMGLLIIGAVLIAANEVSEKAYHSEYPGKTREEWQARPRKGNPPTLQALPRYVVISHTATDTCSNLTDCSRLAREIQNYHMDSLNLLDIGYHYLIGGDGKVYLARHRYFEGDHTRDYNNRSIGISFIGDYNKVAPTREQILAATSLLDFVEDTGMITRDYQLLGQRQCESTNSPGDKLYEIIKTLNHWNGSVSPPPTSAASTTHSRQALGTWLTIVALTSLTLLISKVKY